MEEAHEEHDVNPPSQPNATRANHHRGPKAPPGKQFPVKLYRMLEDETVTSYVSWSTNEHADAICIPNIEAFVVNVMPKHFKEMKQWGSFQKQLHNYGFEKQDRGAGKALYTHSGNKFLKGRPDLLPEVLRKPYWKTNEDSSPSQKEASRPIVPTAEGPAPDAGSRANYYSKEDQLVHENTGLKVKILQLERELATAGARQSAMEDRLKATENRLGVIEDQFLGPLRRLGGTVIVDDALNSIIHPGPAPPTSNYDFVRDALVTPTIADSGFPIYHIDPSFGLASRDI
ncbi:hypothetical protein FRC04_005932 [Tulasnella sp. 424]|nr:hypothetical protein FRC04_005932 [Tulasnella sp. 424]KAG8976074.1 hypothetical protein FRC05_004706 [Tulasnella sp. 425]